MRIIIKSVRSGEGFSVLSDVLHLFLTRTSTSYPTVQLLLWRWSCCVPYKKPSTWGIVSVITLLLMAVHESALLYILAAALRCRSCMYLVHHWHPVAQGSSSFISSPSPAMKSGGVCDGTDGSACEQSSESCFLSMLLQVWCDFCIKSSSFTASLTLARRGLSCSVGG